MESRLLDAGRDELGQAVMESIQDQMEAITFAALRHRSDCVKKGGSSCLTQFVYGIQLRLLYTHIYIHWSPRDVLYCLIYFYVYSNAMNLLP